MGENMVIIREPKTFYFGFDWSKNVDENNEIEQFLSTYKHGNNIHEYGKQQKRMNHINLTLTCHKD